MSEAFHYYDEPQQAALAQQDQPAIPLSPIVPAVVPPESSAKPVISKKTWLYIILVIAILALIYGIYCMMQGKGAEALPMNEVVKYYYF